LIAIRAQSPACPAQHGSIPRDGAAGICPARAKTGKTKRSTEWNRRKRADEKRNRSGKDI